MSLINLYFLKKVITFTQVSGSLFVIINSRKHFRLGGMDGIQSNFQKPNQPKHLKHIILVASEWRNTKLL